MTYKVWQCYIIFMFYCFFSTHLGDKLLDLLFILQPNTRRSRKKKNFVSYLNNKTGPPDSSLWSCSCSCSFGPFTPGTKCDLGGFVFVMHHSEAFVAFTRAQSEEKKRKNSIKRKWYMYTAYGALIPSNTVYWYPVSMNESSGIIRRIVILPFVTQVKHKDI